MREHGRDPTRRQATRIQRLADRHKMIRHRRHRRHLAPCAVPRLRVFRLNNVDFADPRRRYNKSDVVLVRLHVVKLFNEALITIAFRLASVLMSGACIDARSSARFVSHSSRCVTTAFSTGSVCRLRYHQ